MADRNVAGAVRRGRQADAGQPGDDAVDAVGLGVDRDIALRARLGDPAVERRFVGDRLILRTVDLDLLRAFGLGDFDGVVGLRSIAAMTSLRTVAPVLAASRRRPSG